MTHSFFLDPTQYSVPTLATQLALRLNAKTVLTAQSGYNWTAGSYQLKISGDHKADLQLMVDGNTTDG